MRTLKSVLIAVSLAAIAAPAYADCVDYSLERGKAEADRLTASPPASAALGIPDLAGLELDAVKTVGDPVCDGPVTDYWFRGSVPFRAFVENIYPNIAPRITVDGMERQWYNNPYHSDDITLSSGTVLTLFLDANQNVFQVNVKPASPPGALVAASQPYSVDDIVSGTPWVGGENGNFVQVGGSAAPMASSTPAAEAACPATQAGAEAESVGKEIGGRLLGGGFGRSVGGAVGGLLGGGKKQADTPAPSGC